MAQKIPFFHMFADLRLPAELQFRLSGTHIAGALIDEKAGMMQLQLITRASLSDADVADLQRLIAATYGFERVVVTAERESSERAFLMVSTVIWFIAPEGSGRMRSGWTPRFTMEFLSSR